MNKYFYLFLTLGTIIAIILIIACAPSASQQSTQSNKGWVDLDGNLQSRDINSFTTCYRSASNGNGLSCVVHP